MKKVAKFILKGLLLVFCLALILYALIFTVRKYNQSKYQTYGQIGEAYEDPTNPAAYDTDIEGVEVTRIVGDYLNGFRLTPDNKTRQGVIISFGGSEGSPGYDTAQALAQEGYEVLSLFYFGMDNQAPDLVHVPLEFFEEVLAYIDDHMDDDPVITVYGGSKGAELALNLASYYPQIDNLVLMAPAAWNYMGLTEDYSQGMQSSWTYGGDPLPFIDMTKGNLGDGLGLIVDLTLNQPVAYRPGYESATLNDPQSEAARIKAEATDANILIFAGDNDRLWHSEISAQKIQEVRPENTEVHIFPGAGHIFALDRYLALDGIVIEMGGSLEANQEAGQKAQEILLDRLSQWHGDVDSTS